jgi:hypothetical protein
VVRRSRYSLSFYDAILGEGRAAPVTWFVTATLVIGLLAALTKLAEGLAGLLEKWIALREAQARWRRDGGANSDEAALDDDADARR